MTPELRIVLAGAGNIGRYLAFSLAQRGHVITIIERDAEELAKVPLGQVRTVVGDACSPEVLTNAGVGDADVVVALSGDDEDNLVISLLAKEEFAVPRVMARVNYPSNEWLFDSSWGVDVVISPPHLLTALVEEEVVSGELVSLLKLKRGEIELLDVRLDEDSEAVGQRVDALALPPGTSIVAIVRGERVIPARGTTQLVERDEILALAPTEAQQAVRDAVIGDR